jgi:hypothetical protein
MRRQSHSGHQDEGQRVNAKHDGAFTAKEIEEAVKDLPTYKLATLTSSVSLSKQALRWKRYLAYSFNWLWTGGHAWSQGVIGEPFQSWRHSAARQLPRDNTGLDSPQDVHEHPAEALETTVVLHEAQAAFRSKCSCADQQFVLA